MRGQRAALGQLLNLAGSLASLGNPANLIGGIATGGQEVFYAPAAGAVEAFSDAVDVLTVATSTRARARVTAPGSQPTFVASPTTLWYLRPCYGAWPRAGVQPTRW